MARRWLSVRVDPVAPRFYVLGRGPPPEIILNRSVVSESRGISLTALVCSSGKSGEGSALVNFWKFTANSRSLNVLLMASDKIWTCSFGVPGGRMNGDPMSVKLRCMSTSFRFLSVFTNLSRPGKESKVGCGKRYPLGISWNLFDSLGLLLRRERRGVCAC